MLINKDTENRLVCPANIDTIELKLIWFQDELNRIIRQNQGIDKIIIKQINLLEAKQVQSGRPYILMPLYFWLQLKKYSNSSKVILTNWCKQ